MRLPKNATTVLRHVLFLAPVLFVVLVVMLANQAIAQEPIGPWSDPVNLSLSAGTSDPALVVDLTGRAHAVW
ncbi:MAG: hypothetical protein PVH65_17175, partial [Chloroflexota bacterium]